MLVVLVVVAVVTMERWDCGGCYGGIEVVV